MPTQTDIFESSVAVGDIVLSKTPNYALPFRIQVWSAGGTGANGGDDGGGGGGGGGYAEMEAYTLTNIALCEIRIDNASGRSSGFLDEGGDNLTVINGDDASGLNGGFGGEFDGSSLISADTNSDGGTGGNGALDLGGGAGGGGGGEGASPGQDGNAGSNATVGGGGAGGTGTAGANGGAGGNHMANGTPGVAPGGGGGGGGKNGTGDLGAGGRVALTYDFIEDEPGLPAQPVGSFMVGPGLVGSALVN